MSAEGECRTEPSIGVRGSSLHDAERLFPIFLMENSL